MTVPLPLPPLTPKDVFLAALAAGRTVPEDETHVVFANCILEQLYKLGHLRSAAVLVKQRERAWSELAAPDACPPNLPLAGHTHAAPQPLCPPQGIRSDCESLAEVWRACLEATAQRVAEMDSAVFTPASCASALRALVRTSSLQCPPCPNIEGAR